MLNKIGLMALLLSFSGFGVAQEQPDRGQLLYENHCRKCHDPLVHTRAERKASDINELSQFVLRWQYDQKLDWNYDEIQDVIRYLNANYYHFRRLP